MYCFLTRRCAKVTKGRLWKRVYVENSRNGTLEVRCAFRNEHGSVRLEGLESEGTDSILKQEELVIHLDILVIPRRFAQGKEPTSKVTISSNPARNSSIYCRAR